MATPVNIDNILTQVKNLDKEEQFALLQRLTSILKNAEKPESSIIRLSALTGLGSDVWKSSSHIDNYIDEERQW